MTIFGNNTLPRGGTVWTGAVVDALATLGVEEKTARQALARTAADGWLTRSRTGRRVRWTFTPAGHELFTRGAERIFSFGRAAPEWDGSWLVLFTSVPESRREVRHRLRTRLAWAGFGSPAPGVWLTPDPSREAEAKDVLGELGLDDQASSFVARYGDDRRPARDRCRRVGRSLAARALRRVPRGVHRGRADRRRSGLRRAHPTRRPLAPLPVRRSRLAAGTAHRGVERHACRRAVPRPATASWYERAAGMVRRNGRAPRGR